MDIQRALGSDIAMAFDECPPHDCAPREAAQPPSSARSAGRGECREQPRAAGQVVFGIVQGGSRRRAARAMRQANWWRWISTATPSAA